MAANVPDVVKEPCAKPVFAHLATLTKDGGPQVTPVWIDFDGSLIWINTAKDRIRTRTCGAINASPFPFSIQITRTSTRPYAVRSRRLRRTARMRTSTDGEEIFEQRSLPFS